MVRLTDDIILNPNLSKTLVDFLRALEYHVNAEGTCWPGRNRIAAVMRCSVRTVSRCIKEAVELSLIEVRRRKRRSNIYTLTCAEIYPQKNLDVPPNRHPEQASVLKNNVLNGTSTTPWKSPAEINLLIQDLTETFGDEITARNRGWFYTIAAKVQDSLIYESLSWLRQTLMESEISGRSIESPSALFTWKLRQAEAPI